VTVDCSQEEPKF